MKLIQTHLADCIIIEPTLFEDERGYFYESFNEKKFKELAGFETHFVQDNEAKSNTGVLRGLHFQKGEHAQAKLVRVLQGKVWDVAVDLRPNSNTYGKYICLELTGENKKQLYIPRGFAHGYVVLEDNTVFSYKCDNFYNKESEGGLYFADNTLQIPWPIDGIELILSEKDKVLEQFIPM
jgi:dTDP-4-dehydrorhamnose 3,5-epimerase